ncbi:hypothetical protein EV102420_02_04310 [Pseudescherichia vulneris NBRC 102420]|uniref:MarR family transcriptional regulator n=1 Tax=Pseudescherichia vulneris NBRC 102420 TaxID=1115515 RepID=A0A090UWD3_PSEVU|nr:hypothetical protein EV102420_02_04310 [Pseudescherichia vulneris NBRC 102420]STQ61615.1 Uncharacterised protein [Pseudescherichia vulneris]
MLNNTELNILKLLASRNDVNWNWYNLDRAMAMRNMEGIGNVAQLVKNLSEAGLVDVILRAPVGMDHDKVSERGYRLLEELEHQDLSHVDMLK